ncbi:Fad dependent [Salix suchowensis]|nr:Fad dependent [Salix suchowensis]
MAEQCRGVAASGMVQNDRLANDQRRLTSSMRPWLAWFVGSDRTVQVYRGEGETMDTEVSATSRTPGNVCCERGSKSSVTLNDHCTAPIGLTDDGTAEMKFAHGTPCGSLHRHSSTPTTTMAADIPIDILDNVLMYVGDGKSELGAFSLVCKSWCTPTRSRMFSTFALNYTVDDLPGFRQCTRLLSLLEDSPHLSQLFRRIELHIHTASPLVHDPILHQLLSYFPNVRTLVLRAFADAWISLPPDLVTSLRLIVCNPLFERLHLSHWRFTPGAGELAHLLSGCANSLRYLSLTHVSYDVHSGGTAAVDTLLLADLPKLAAMNVFGSSTDGHLPCKIPNLQQYSQTPSVSQFLGVLYRAKPHTRDDDHYQRCLLFHASCLEAILRVYSPNLLSHLEELMVVMPFHSPVHSIDLDDGSAWEQATDSLGPLVDAGQLRSVTLSLNLSSPNSNDIDLFVRHIRTSLLSLDRKGVLKVETMVDANGTLNALHFQAVSAHGTDLTSIVYQFFFFSRKATRSLSISATLASGNAPERLVSARRAPASDSIAKRGPTLHHTGQFPLQTSRLALQRRRLRRDLGHQCQPHSVDGGMCTLFWCSPITDFLRLMRIYVKGLYQWREANGNVDGTISSSSSTRLVCKYDEVAMKVAESPGLPVINTSAPYWAIPPAPIACHGAKDPIPPLQPGKATERLEAHVGCSDADVVIIGSGVTGAAVARTLLDWDARRVREHGVSRFELLCLRRGTHVPVLPQGEFGIRRHRCPAYHSVSPSPPPGVPPCRRRGRPPYRFTSKKVQTFDVFFDRETFLQAKTKLEEYARDMPDEGKVYSALDPADGVDLVENTDRRLQEYQLSPRAAGCITTAAGAIHPYRLITGILSRLLNEYSDHITSTKGGSSYSISTPRGTLRAPHVVHATNGWVSHLLEPLRGKIIPLRATMTAQRPGVSLGAPLSDLARPTVIDDPGKRNRNGWMPSSSAGLEAQQIASQSKTRAPLAVTRRTQRLTAILHAALRMVIYFTLTKRRYVVITRNSDDRSFHLPTASYLSGALPLYFSGWGEEGRGADAPRRDVDPGRVKSVWTGILGMSADGMPWVGRIPVKISGRVVPSSAAVLARTLASPGEWIAAGYSGEGMVHAWMSAKAVAYMILNADDERERHNPLGKPANDGEDWLPKPYLVSEKRLKESNMDKFLESFLG